MKRSSCSGSDERYALRLKTKPVIVGIAQLTLCRGPHREESGFCANPLSRHCLKRRPNRIKFGSIQAVEEVDHGLAIDDRTQVERAALHRNCRRLRADSFVIGVLPDQLLDDQSLRGVLHRQGGTASAQNDKPGLIAGETGRKGQLRRHRERGRGKLLQQQVSTTVL